MCRRHPYGTTCFEGNCVPWVAFASLPALTWHLIALSRGIYPRSPVPTGVHTLAWTAAEWISWEPSIFFLRLVLMNLVSVNLLRNWKRVYFRCEARSAWVEKRRRGFDLSFFLSIRRFFFLVFGNQEFMSCYSQSHLGWHFQMLFQSSKIKAQTSLWPRFSEKRRSSFEPWASRELSQMSPHVGFAVYKRFSRWET